MNNHECINEIKELLTSTEDKFSSIVKANKINVDKELIAAKENIYKYFKSIQALLTEDFFLWVKWVDPHPTSSFNDKKYEIHLRAFVERGGHITFHDTQRSNYEAYMPLTAHVSPTTKTGYGDNLYKNLDNKAIIYIVNNFDKIKILIENEIKKEYTKRQDRVNNSAIKYSRELQNLINFNAE